MFNRNTIESLGPTPGLRRARARTFRRLVRRLTGAGSSQRHRGAILREQLRRQGNFSPVFVVVHRGEWW